VSISSLVQTYPAPTPNSGSLQRRRGGRSIVGPAPYTYVAAGRWSGQQSGLGDVLRLQALPAFGYLVADLLALVEGLEPAALYAGVVDEEILAPLIRGDEAVALLLAEPLYRSFLGQLRSYARVTAG
jgi:hypothetical protein